MKKLKKGHVLFQVIGSQLIEWTVSSISFRQRVGQTKVYIKSEFLKPISFVEGQLPRGIFTTKLQAITAKIKESTEDVAWYNDTIAALKDPADRADYAEERDDLVKDIRVLKGKLTKLRNAKK